MLGTKNGTKNDEILTYLLLIIVGYIIAKMFSKRCEGFSVGANDADCESSSDCVSGNCCTSTIFSTCGGENCCMNNGNNWDYLSTTSCSKVYGGSNIKAVKKNIYDNCWRDIDCNSGLCRTSKGEKSDTLKYPNPREFGPKLGASGTYNDLRCRVKEGSNCSGNIDCLYPTKCIFDIDDKGTCINASSCEDKVAELCPFIGSPLDESGVLPPGISPSNRKQQCLECISNNRMELAKSDCHAEDFDKICDTQSDGTFFKKYCQDDGKACNDLIFKSKTQNNCNTELKNGDGKVVDNTSKYCKIGTDKCEPRCTDSVNCRSDELSFDGCDDYNGNRSKCLNAYSGGFSFNNYRCIYNDNNKTCNDSKIKCVS
jgi:hypothetical protein